MTKTGHKSIWKQQSYGAYSLKSKILEGDFLKGTFIQTFINSFMGRRIDPWMNYLGRHLKINVDI